MLSEFDERVKVIVIMEDDVDVRGLVMGPFQTLLSFFISLIFLDYLPLFFPMELIINE